MITRLWRTALVRLMPWYDERTERAENARTASLVAKANRAATLLASFEAAEHDLRREP